MERYRVCFISPTQAERFRRALLDLPLVFSDVSNVYFDDDDYACVAYTPIHVNWREVINKIYWDIVS